VCVVSERESARVCLCICVKEREGERGSTRGREKRWEKNGSGRIGTERKREIAFVPVQSAAWGFWTFS